MKPKRFIWFYSLLCLAAGIALSSYTFDPVYYGEYLPVYMVRPEMEKAVKAEAPLALNHPGKIFFSNQYLFINEKYKGIHVVDNSNPSAPVYKSFIHIDGCIDMAIKNGIIYADNAIDLIALQPNADFTAVTVTGRVRNVFPEVESPDGYWTQSQINEFRPDGGILVAWKRKSSNIYN